ncbi:hypothetical protein [Gulosibacter bifidus]|uniref:Uncharacterized protein n=1 Tax=Gulosibacter bifidus TaxID=272239 RepID=A0ABW5RJ77_9MICO|nr:hypothetical protein [Gulosibacter bifidus]
MPANTAEVTPAELSDYLAEAGSDSARVAECAAAATAYVRRYRTEWDESCHLGALHLAAGLYRDRATPGIAEGWESAQNVFARLTDVRIEQLCRIGRFAPPRIG